MYVRGSSAMVSGLSVRSTGRQVQNLPYALKAKLPSLPELSHQCSVIVVFFASCMFSGMR